jgi:transgelin
MASVSSLDGDLRKLRLDKYTPAAANEARAWIEGMLGERMKSGDLLEGLKDGTMLCRYVWFHHVVARRVPFYSSTV